MEECVETNSVNCSLTQLVMIGYLKEVELLRSKDGEKLSDMQKTLDYELLSSFKIMFLVKTLKILKSTAHNHQKITCKG